MAFQLTATYITVGCESSIHRLLDVKIEKEPEATYTDLSI